MRASLTSNQLLALSENLEKIGPLEVQRVLQAFAQFTR